MFGLRILGRTLFALALVAFTLNVGGMQTWAQNTYQQITGLPDGAIGNPTISAQTATKGIYFTSKGVGLAGHLLSNISTGNPTPTLSSCGDTPTLATGSNDKWGQVTQGGTATTCTITFGTAWANAPFCIVQDMTTGARAAVYTVSTTAITITALTASDVIAYHCAGAS